MTISSETQGIARGGGPFDRVPLADQEATPEERPTDADPLQQPWAVPARAVTETLKTDVERGLSDEDVAERLSTYGPNQLRTHRRRSAWSILVAQFKSLIIGLLLAAAVVAFLFGETLEAGAVVAVLVINTLIGFWTEWRAVRSMEALFALGRVETRVRRAGAEKMVPAESLVPGDVVIVEGGDIVTADLRLVEGSKLQADESTLTGESVPVSKQVAPVATDTIVAERSPILFKGTSVTRGAGVGVVVATGAATELGQISRLVEDAEDDATPLEKRLDRLGHRLIAVTLVLAAAVSVVGWMTGKDLVLMVETGIALAVATIPEGLPIVATIVLAQGMRMMARRNALINRLSSVETLGATSVIFTDKTGTLTENRMAVTRLVLSTGDVFVDEGVFRRDGEKVAVREDDVLRMALETGVLCNDATFAPDCPDDASGDPLERALLAVGARAKLRREVLVRRWPEVREEAFDPDVKMMATVHRSGGSYRVAVKGAPEAVLAVSTKFLSAEGIAPLDDASRKRWNERNEAMAADGLRVLAVAVRWMDTPSSPVYEDLVFVGLVGLEDPPRHDVAEALADCQAAGIRVIMATGDQPATAVGVGRAVGLVDGAEAPVMHGRALQDTGPGAPGAEADVLQTAIFARVSPRQKLDLIHLYQQQGHIVAMTGDGVNDAPALKEADIGIAMGRRGTQVAREAADMVLQDDAFSSIVAAIEQGRIIFGNLRRFVFYLMSCNVSEVLVVGFASLFSTVLPILPLQILFLNLVTDVFPALALGMSKGEKGVMQRPPRDPREPILARRHWFGIARYGVLFTVVVLGALYVALDVLHMPREQAVTVSFLTLASTQLLHVFNMRGRRSGLVRNEVVRNPYVWAALALCAAMILSVVYVPALAQVFSVRPPGMRGWGLLLGMSAVPLVLGQVTKEIGRLRARTQPSRTRQSGSG